MPDELPFADLVRKVRDGDQDAAAELVRHYEPTIRRVVRFRMADTRLGAALDSMDICQSVLASFFVRAAAGQYELDTPENLIQLLVTMARNKLASQVRKERADCRDQRRRTAGNEALDLAPGSDATPSRHAVAREMLEETYRRLTPAERQLVELRNQGLAWEAIAEQLGEPSANLRQRLSRALDRVARELGIDAEEA